MNNQGNWAEQVMERGDLLNLNEKVYSIRIDPRLFENASEDVPVEGTVKRDFGIGDDGSSNMGMNMGVNNMNMPQLYLFGAFLIRKSNVDSIQKKILARKENHTGR